jgi:hypothetical protein
MTALPVKIRIFVRVTFIGKYLLAFWKGLLPPKRR